MSWIQSLCNAYETVMTASSDGTASLLPIGFTQKDIKFHIILDQKGEFQSAQVWDDKKVKHFEVVPSTPQAESRTGENGAPFPLADQLKYFVCDQEETLRFQKYMAQLTEWCQAEDAPQCLSALKTYLEGKTILQDLTEKQKLNVKYHKDSEKKDGKGPDAKAFVVFSVYSESDEMPDELWKRSDVRKSWEKHIAAHASTEQKLCYVEGKVLPSIENHPKVQGNAKLISAKDAAFPFQYKGRFTEDRSAALVSFSASIRVHNVLNWLVEHQGFRKYGMTWVAWNTAAKMMSVSVDDDDYSYFEDEEEAIQSADTCKAYAEAIKNARLGWKNELETYVPENKDFISVLGMEAATDGRMSITYYQELPGNTYVEHLKNWYADCCWGKIHWEEVNEDGKSVKNPKMQIFTPTAPQIAEAVIGADTVQTAKSDMKCEKSATKLLRETNLRLMSCIAGESPFPHDMVTSAFHRAVSPLSFTDNKGNWQEWKWRECISTTCALIHKEQVQSGGSVFDAMLDTSSRDRDYLYGRLLAVAHHAECKAGDFKKPMTNAVRLFQRFVQRPRETWAQLHDKLIPYLSHLSKKHGKEFYQSVIGDIEAQFDGEALASQTSLGLTFLQGFHSQYLALTCKSSSLTAEAVFPNPQSRSEKFGCLLAVADYIELKAGESKEEPYSYEHAGNTLAQRMMPMFAARPVETWDYIHSRLIPYLEKLEKQDAGKNEDYQVEKEMNFSPHLEKRYAELLCWAENQFAEQERDEGGRLERSYLNSYYRTKKALLHHLTPPKERISHAETLSREMIYGRLLGLENSIERYVMDNVQKVSAGQYRPSNAVRQMPNFAKCPAENWEKLEGKLAAYQKHLPKAQEWRSQEADRLKNILMEQDWHTNDPLNGTYLYYYYQTNTKKEN